MTFVSTSGFELPFLLIVEGALGGFRRVVMLLWTLAFRDSPSFDAVFRSTTIVFGSTSWTRMSINSLSAPSSALRKNGLSWMFFVPNSFQAATFVTGVPSGYLELDQNPTSIFPTPLAFFRFRRNRFSLASIFTLAI